jgi:hypothetical protein
MTHEIARAFKHDRVRRQTFLLDIEVFGAHLGSYPRNKHA